MVSADMCVSDSTLQRVSGHFDPHQVVSSLDHHNDHTHPPEDDVSGSYVDDFDSDSHHSSYQSPEVYYAQSQLGGRAGPPEVVYATIGRPVSFAHAQSGQVMFGCAERLPCRVGF